MYRVATFLLREWWGKPPEMADALAVLLLTWNQAYYRYGGFDLKSLEECLAKHWPEIESFRGRNITSLTSDDYASVTALFEDMQVALANSKGKSPVGVAKALHLLAPSFFPIWDMKIAAKYGCRYASDPARAYIRFCEKNRGIVEALGPVSPHPSKSLLKRIDEYNYVWFTKKWLDGSP
jgi:hypothetical protein